jgi:hypothetical protein
MPLTFARWGILRLEALQPLTVVECREFRDRTEMLPRVLSLLAVGPPVVPRADWLQLWLQEVTSRWSPYTGQPPIFLDAHPSLRAMDLEDFFVPVVAGLRTVRLTPAEDWRPRSAFALPLRIAAVGADVEAWLAELQSQHWTQGEEVRRHGLAVHMATRDVASLMHAVDPHVVVTDQPGEALEVASALPEPRRPRLVIWVDSTLDSPAPATMSRSVPGVALLRVSSPGPGSVTPAGDPLGRFFAALFTEFTHDLPLHLMADAAARAAGLRIRLTADPYSLQSMRLCEALRELQREGRRWELQVPRAQTVDMVRAWIDESRNVRNFLGESHAFVPMARARATRDVAHAALEALRHEAGGFRGARGPGAAGPRAVHVALERLESGAYLTAVEAESSLAAGNVYGVRLHIGIRLPDSLVETDTPIDPLLGPPDEEEGYRLEAAIQGKDFDVLSERTLPLFLPLEGNSAPIYFEVRAPERPGPAQLRLCIYHRNHLVQSFLLDATIDPAERAYPTRTLTVRLETSRAEDLATVDRLGPRALSIGLNRSTSRGTHQLILKADDSAGEVTLPGSTFKESADKIRSLLDQAARDPLSPVLLRDYTPLASGAPPSEAVAETIRALVEWGRKLYDAFFARAARPGSTLRPHLVKLAASQAQRIQVIRFEYEDAFPWPLLYDWERPGDPGAAVCLGGEASPTAQVTPCAHNAASGLFCVRGFWGVRHYVEELIGERGDAVTSVTASRQTQPVRLVADAGLPESGPLRTELATELGAGAVATGPAHPGQLLDLLFQKADQRPALLILLGHHDRQARAGGTDLSRIQIDSPEVWLSEEAVSSRASNQPAPWEQPRSIVLLMACSSVPTGIQTLTDFVTAWTVSGAAAIVGTECVVGSRLAATFARTFTARVWKNREPLGPAMTGIRARLLAEGNPLAFLFHAIGDVDLVLQ